MKRWNVLGAFTSLDELNRQLLKNRGITDEAEVIEFLDPLPIRKHLQNMPPEFKEALKSARKLILKAIDQGRPIVVHGDYDADGICATAILYNCLAKDLEYPNVDAFIPNRFDHGYGLSEKSIKAILKEFSNEKILFITVDSGITAVDEVSRLKELGHEVIITDHHQKPEELPEADVIFWSDKVVGATLAWVLSRALGSLNKSSLSLACIATVTDIQPLTGFNRSVVLKGLEILNSNPPIGIKKLIEYSGKRVSDISPGDIGWIIGPRLNASGRMKDAHDALKLLTSSRESDIDGHAKFLNELNHERQETTLKMYDVARAHIPNDSARIIISHDENYHEGIIGLVAARLVQKHFLPAIVISIEDGFGKGSVRSIPGINIIELLREFDDMFLSLGGHPMAAGFSIEKEKIRMLEEKLNKAMSRYDESVFIPQINIDLELPAEVLSLELYDKLQELRPFGEGNKEPKFITRGFAVAGKSSIGRDNQHIILRLYDEDSDNFFKGIMFNGVDHVTLKDLREGDAVDVVYKLNKNEFNGKVSLDLILEDLKYNENRER